MHREVREKGLVSRNNEQMACKLKSVIIREGDNSFVQVVQSDKKEAAYGDGRAQPANLLVYNEVGVEMIVKMQNAMVGVVDKAWSVRGIQNMMQA